MQSHVQKPVISIKADFSRFGEFEQHPALFQSKSMAAPSLCKLYQGSQNKIKKALPIPLWNRLKLLLTR